MLPELVIPELPTVKLFVPIPNVLPDPTVRLLIIVSGLETLVVFVDPVKERLYTVTFPPPPMPSVEPSPDNVTVPAVHEEQITTPVPTVVRFPPEMARFCEFNESVVPVPTVTTLLALTALCSVIVPEPEVVRL